MRQGVNLVFNNTVVPSVYFPGGKSVLVTRASAYGTAQLQFQLDDQTWVNVGAASTADGISSGLDLPAGQYRMNVSGQTGMYASLATISYM